MTGSPSKQAAPEFLALTIVLCGIIFSLPLWLHKGEVALASDIQYHLPWTENFARQLWSGELYPRWLEHMNGGLGSPTFFFYPPLPFYVSSLFYPLAALIGIPWYAVAAASTTAMIASGFAAHAWLRSFATPRTSLIAAIFYMMIPYHLGVDLYARFSYTEFWAFVWLPLILLASRPDESTAPPPTTVLRTCMRVATPYALLSLTHLPTLLLFSAVPVIQAIILPSSNRRFPHVIGVGTGMVLGFAMAAAYTVPAWGNRAFISTVEVHTSGASFYARNFLIDAQRDVVVPHIDWFERGLDLWICLVLAFTVYVAMFLRRLERNKPNREVWFWVLVALGSVLITTRLAEPLWRSIPVIQIVEFPWRFGTVSTVAVTALLGWVLSNAQVSETNLGAVENVGSWKSIAFLSFSILAFALVTFWYTSNIYGHPIPWFVTSIAAAAFLYCREYGLGAPAYRNPRPVLGIWLISSFLILTNTPHVIPQLAWHLETLRHRGHVASAVTDDVQKQLDIEFDSWEYRTHYVRPENFNHEHIAQLRSSMQPVKMLSGNGTVSIVDHTARRLDIEVNAASPITILLRRYFYPGTVFVDAAGKPLGKVMPSAEEGLVMANLPAGHYHAIMVLTKSANEKLGLWISCIAISLYIGLTLSRPTNIKLTKKYSRFEPDLAG